MKQSELIVGQNYLHKQWTEHRYKALAGCNSGQRVLLNVTTNSICGTDCILTQDFLDNLVPADEFWNEIPKPAFSFQELIDKAPRGVYKIINSSPHSKCEFHCIKGNIGGKNTVLWLNGDDQFEVADACWGSSTFDFQFSLVQENIRSEYCVRVW